MATPESKVKEACKAIFEKYKCWWFMPPANGYGRAGIPDFIGCYKGLFFAVECKAGKGQTTALQERELKLITDNFGMAMVIREDTVYLLEQWFKELS